MNNDDQTRKAFAGAIGAAYIATGKEAPTPSVLRLFWEVLKGYDLADVQRAVMAHMSDPDAGQFAPKPADLIRIIDGDTKTRSAIAWAKVDNAIRRVGQYASVIFDDPLIHATVSDMGGWTELCRVMTDELPFKASEFDNRYRAYCKQPPAGYPRQLAGVIATENGAKGFDAEPPVLIGDSDKAKEVYRLGGDCGTLQITRVKDAAQLVASAMERIGGRDAAPMIATEAEKSPAAAFEREILPEIACDRLNALRDDFEAKRDAYTGGGKCES